MVIITGQHLSSARYHNFFIILLRFIPFQVGRYHHIMGRDAPASWTHQDSVLWSQPQHADCSHHSTITYCCALNNFQWSHPRQNVCVAVCVLSSGLRNYYCITYRAKHTKVMATILRTAVFSHLKVGLSTISWLFMYLKVSTWNCLSILELT